MIELDAPIENEIDDLLVKASETNKLTMKGLLLLQKQIIGLNKTTGHVADSILNFIEIADKNFFLLSNKIEAIEKRLKGD